MPNGDGKTSNLDEQVQYLRSPIIASATPSFSYLPCILEPLIPIIVKFHCLHVHQDFSYEIHRMMATIAMVTTIAVHRKKRSVVVDSLRCSLSCWVDSL